MNINFIIVCLNFLKDECSDDELQMIYQYLLFIDNDTLFSYYYKKTTFNYDNDLLLYIDVIDKTIKMFEKNEEYEKCYYLNNKKIECLNIINNINLKL